MITKSRRLTYLCIGVTVLLAAARPAAAESYKFFRLNWDAGESDWEKDAAGKYKVVIVGLHEPSDITYYAAGTNCGNADHKPGGADWPKHLHVHRDNDSSAPWVAASASCSSGSKNASKQFYAAMILNNGGDPAASVFDADDG